jgi:hypothetical protein
VYHLQVHEHLPKHMANPPGVLQLPRWQGCIARANCVGRLQGEQHPDSVWPAAHTPTIAKTTPLADHKLRQVLPPWQVC